MSLLPSENLRTWPFSKKAKMTFAGSHPMCHINTVRNRINSAAVLPYMKEEAGGMHRGKPCAAPCERRIGAIVRFSQMVGYWAAFGLQMVGYWAAFGTVKVNSQPLLSSSRLFQQRSLNRVSMTFRNESGCRIFHLGMSHPKMVIGNFAEGGIHVGFHVGFHVGYTTIKQPLPQRNSEK